MHIFHSITATFSTRTYSPATTIPIRVSSRCSRNQVLMCLLRVEWVVSYYYQEEPFFQSGEKQVMSIGRMCTNGCWRGCGLMTRDPCWSIQRTLHSGSIDGWVATGSLLTMVLMRRASSQVLPSVTGVLWLWQDPWCGFMEVLESVWSWMVITIVLLSRRGCISGVENVRWRRMVQWWYSRKSSWMT